MSNNRSPTLSINSTLLSPIQSPHLTPRPTISTTTTFSINSIKQQANIIYQEYSQLPPAIQYALLYKMLGEIKDRSYYNWFCHAFSSPRNFLVKLPVVFLCRVVKYLDQDSLLILVKLCHKTYHLFTPPVPSRIQNRLNYAHGIGNHYWKHLMIKYQYLDTEKLQEQNYQKYLLFPTGDGSKYDPSYCYFNAKSFNYIDDLTDYYWLFNKENAKLRGWKEGKYQLKEINTHEGVITCIQFDDTKLVTGSDNNDIRVYSIQTGELQKVMLGHDGGVWALKFASSILVSGSTDRTVRVWDLDKGICTHTFYGHSSTIRCLLLLFPSPFNNGVKKPVIVSGSRDSSIKIWKLPNSKSLPYHHNDTTDDNPYLIYTLRGHTLSVRSIAARKKYVISGSYDNTVKIWDIVTGKCLRTLQGHDQKVYSVLLSKNLNYAYSAGLDAKVRIWYIEPIIKNTKAEIKQWSLNGHISLVGLLQLSKHGLFSAAADGIIKVWNSAPNDDSSSSVESEQTLLGHIGAITCFHHDAYRIVSGSDNFIKLWWKSPDGNYSQSYELSSDLQAVWQLSFNNSYCVAAVQKLEGTFVQIFKF